MLNNVGIGSADFAPSPARILLCGRANDARCAFGPYLCLNSKIFFNEML